MRSVSCIVVSFLCCFCFVVFSGFPPHPFRSNRVPIIVLPRCCPTLPPFLLFTEVPSSSCPFVVPSSHLSIRRLLFLSLVLLWHSPLLRSFPIEFRSARVSSIGILPFSVPFQLNSVHCAYLPILLFRQARPLARANAC